MRAHQGTLKNHGKENHQFAKEGEESAGELRSRTVEGGEREGNGASLSANRSGDDGAESGSGLFAWRSAAPVFTRRLLDGPLAMKARVPAPTEIADDTPLRLGVAAQLAFPDGSMTVSGLRRERDRARLIVETIAGKEYTTLAAIAQMRTLCRDEKRLHVSGFRKSDEKKESSALGQPGSSSITASKLPQDALRAKLRKRKRSSPNTSPANMNRRVEREISKP